MMSFIWYFPFVLVFMSCKMYTKSESFSKTMHFMNLGANLAEKKLPAFDCTKFLRHTMLFGLHTTLKVGQVGLFPLFNVKVVNSESGVSAEVVDWLILKVLSLLIRLWIWIVNGKNYLWVFRCTEGF